MESAVTPAPTGRLRNPRDRVDVFVGRRIPPHHLEVLEELQQNDVELRVDGRDGEGQRKREPAGEKSPHEGRLEPDGNALVPAPADDAERIQTGEEVAGRVDPEKGIPGCPLLDGDERQPEQQQRFGDDGDRLVAEASPDVEDGAQQARVARSQQEYERGQRVGKERRTEQTEGHRQEDQRDQGEE